MNFSDLTKDIKEKHANFIVSEVNDHCMRIAVLQGDYVWHFHPDSDELFIVLEGELLIDFKDRGTEAVKPNDSLLIPRGAIHRTRANVRTVNLCMEKTSAETVIFAEGHVLKLIQCKPAGQNKRPFSEAQAKWRPLQNINGLIRQWGGWRESENGPEAVIMALWKTKRDYLQFMEREHDLIYERTSQKGTFESSNIELIENPIDISRTLEKRALGLVLEPEWTVNGVRG